MDKKHINTLSEIVDLADQKKSLSGNVVWARKPIPASWVINMSGRVIFNGLKQGLWIHEKENEK